MMTIGFELEFLMSAEGCPSCEGFGYGYCPTCEGTGSTHCSFCESTGDIECPHCAGNGKFGCPRCDGEGYINDGNGNMICPNCGGTGYMVCLDCVGTGYIACPDCGGTGSDYCPDCDGTGRVDCPDCGGAGYITNDGAVAEKLEAHGADVGYDSSVRCFCEEDEGRELRSPVFDFSDKERLYNFIHTVTSIIKESDGESSPDYNCGLHVHVCPFDGWSPDARRKLYRAWVNWAEEMFIEHFCPATHRLLDYAYRWTDWLSDCSPDEYDLALQGMACPHSRYMTLNVRSLYAHGTIEFRLFDGTLEASEILEAIEWVGTLVEAVLTHEEDGEDEEIKKYFEEQLGLVVQAA